MVFHLNRKMGICVCTRGDVVGKTTTLIQGTLYFGQLYVLGYKKIAGSRSTNRHSARQLIPRIKYIDALYT